MIMGWFRTASSREAIADLKRRLASSEKDTTYWRNEYGNKQAELVEAQEKAELERSLDQATIKDLQGNLEKALANAARLEEKLTAASAVIEDETDKRMKAKEQQMKAKKLLLGYVKTITDEVDHWSY